MPLGHVVAKVIRPSEDRFFPVWSERTDPDLIREFARSARITIQFIDPEGIGWEREGDDEPYRSHLRPTLKAKR